MARTADDEAPAAPSQPPIVGEDSTPWLGMDAILAHLNAAPSSGDSRGGEGGGGSPGPLNMNIHEFMKLDRNLQDQVLGTWGGMSPGVSMPIAPWDSNDPANAPNLPSKLWYAAPEGSRARFLECVHSSSSVVEKRGFPHRDERAAHLALDRPAVERRRRRPVPRG
jgi:hypothetical protein